MRIASRGITAMEAASSCSVVATTRLSWCGGWQVREGGLGRIGDVPPRPRDDRDGPADPSRWVTAVGQTCMSNEAERRSSYRIMMLAADGHEVTVLESDGDGAPISPVEAWASWRRRGVAQFRQPHNLFTRFRRICDQELPGLTERLLAAGCVWVDYLDSVPPTLSDTSPRPGMRRAAVHHQYSPSNRVRDRGSGAGPAAGIGAPRGAGCRAASRCVSDPGASRTPRGSIPTAGNRSARTS
jgi:hypothetical protein